MVCVRALPEPDRGARTRPPYGQHTEAVADKLRQLVVQDSSGGAGASNLSDAEVVRLAEQATGRDARLPGVYTREDADRIGKAWVAADGGIAQVLEKGDITIYISGNGRRQYRTPTYKRDQGKVQANLESRPGNSGAWESNAHLDIAEGPPGPPEP